jgi:hypothetical protein
MGRVRAADAVEQVEQVAFDKFDFDKAEMDAWRMSDQIEFKRVEDEEISAWRRDVRAVSGAIQRLGSGGSTHEDVSMLTRTIESHHDFRQTSFCSMTPGLMTWAICPGHARAAFYSCTADHIVADALRGFRGHQLGDRTTNLMLLRATNIMAEVAAVIAADLLASVWHNKLLVPVTATNRKLRGVKKIVELTRRHYTVAVYKAMLDRRQRLRKLCLNASTRAELVQNGWGGPASLPVRPCTGRSTDDARTGPSARGCGRAMTVSAAACDDEGATSSI